MAEREDEQTIDIVDLSGGIQTKTTEFLQRANELDDAQNSRYDIIGGVRASEGYVQQGSELTSTTTTSTSSSTTTTSTSSSTSTSTTSTSTSSSMSTSTSTTTTA